MFTECSLSSGESVVLEASRSTGEDASGMPWGSMLQGGKVQERIDERQRLVAGTETD
jgi:hypothetical protein